MPLKPFVGGHTMIGYRSVMIAIVREMDFVPLAARIISTLEKSLLLVQGHLIHLLRYL